jgi:hypothetical protein
LAAIHRCLLAAVRQPAIPQRDCRR